MVLKRYGDPLCRYIKGAPEGLKQLLATENPLKLMKNALYFTLKTFVVLKIFQSLF